MKEIACGDVVPGCDFVARGETEAELFRKVAAHAREVHGIQEITPALMEQVRSRIAEKQERP